MVGRGKGEETESVSLCFFPPKDNGKIQRGIHFVLRLLWVRNKETPAPKAPLAIAIAGVAEDEAARSIVATVSSPGITNFANYTIVNCR